MAKAIGRKIDVAKALELRLKKNMSYADIAKYFNSTKQAVEQALSRFTTLLKDNFDIEAYKTNKIDILSNLELELLTELVDPNKRQKATLGNVAYALDKINNINRLEKGLSTGNYAHIVADIEAVRQLDKESI